MTEATSHTNNTLTFYTLDACSLCEQALEWLDMLGAQQQFTVNIVDIVSAENSAELVEKYGAIVPVIERDSGEFLTQIHAPFSILDLQQFLS